MTKKKYKKNKNLSVVLLEDMPNIGNHGEIKKVKRGYALFLIRNKKAIVINKYNLNKLEKMKLLAEKNKEEAVNRIENIKKKIEDLTFITYITVGENKEIYNSITKNNIRSFLAEHNISVQKNQIELEKSIREEGEFLIPINLGYGIIANLKLIVKQQKIK
ncbi:MAG: hypothetical protein KatS3mg095_0346 [Candidatus Parcubacteria bacterium]|nr:MAG: hypothetical protein KatS3mg095_0346 [Candidatus Parcubacteria bacterium]